MCRGGIGGVCGNGWCAEQAGSCGSDRSGEYKQLEWENVSVSPPVTLLNSYDDCVNTNRDCEVPTLNAKKQLQFRLKRTAQQNGLLSIVSIGVEVIYSIPRIRIIVQFISVHITGIIFKCVT